MGMKSDAIAFVLDYFTEGLEQDGEQLPVILTLDVIVKAMSKRGWNGTIRPDLRNNMLDIRKAVFVECPEWCPVLVHDEVTSVDDIVDIDSHTVRDLCRPGGRVLVCTYNPDHPFWVAVASDCGSVTRASNYTKRLDGMHPDVADPLRKKMQVATGLLPGD